MESAPKKKSHKKLITIVIILLLAAIGGVVALKLNQKNSGEIVNSHISTRAEEFLKKEQENPSSELAQADIKGTRTANPAGSIENVGDCMTVSIPVRVGTVKSTPPCSSSFFIDEPKSILTVYMMEVGYASLEDDPGVHMRRANTDTYRESTQSAQGRTYTVFTNIKQEYEKIAMYMSGKKVYVVSMTANGNAPLDNVFKSVVNSLQIKK